jgi:hypothetical protein
MHHESICEYITFWYGLMELKWDIHYLSDVSAIAIYPGVVARMVTICRDRTIANYA